MKSRPRVQLVTLTCISLQSPDEVLRSINRRVSLIIMEDLDPQVALQ